MTTSQSKIVYTLTDEAPLLATYAFLPILRTFTKAAGITIEESDISLAGRILGEFSDHLSEAQKRPDNLAVLGKATLKPETNIIKLPNISAPVNQLVAAVKELQSQGYKLPDYPESPKDDAEKAIRARYGKILGSAVNPVLREGNSDRRAPPAVKNYARKHPHSMGAWSPASRTHVSTMKAGDFYHSEKSFTVDKARNVRMELVGKGGQATVLKSKLALVAGEIVDTMALSKRALTEFFEREMEDARQTGLLFSVHLKATMMKVSDPIIFGHAVKTYYKDVFDKHAKVFAELGVNANLGMASLHEKIANHPQRDAILADLKAAEAKRPALAMVDSGKGITNLHAANDTIIDASMPAMIRAGGKMYDKDGKLQDAKAAIPDSSFARIYQEAINFCKTHGAFDPVTMGTVPNVGLMAQQAEEYGSHDKTFEIAEAGTARVVDEDNGEVLAETAVEAGDIWRMCRVKDAAIRDWVKLAVTRARNSGTPAVFWLDEERPHEAELRKKVAAYLKEHDTQGLEIHVMSQVPAIRFTMERAMRGLDTISVTGNILRDYLTDLFPIVELGTSAKMLSIVPLMAGGGLYETGAGGSAPKHVQQLVQENHLRWDSLGEFMAIGASIEELGIQNKNGKAKILATTLDAAIGKLLDSNKSPSPKTGELDNRGSQFYLALYWAQALAAQAEDKDLQAKFAPLAKTLAENEQKIVQELAAVQGKPVDIGGYYNPDPKKVEAVMRPSQTLNAAIAAAQG